jgi:hypothetical protein
MDIGLSRVRVGEARTTLREINSSMRLRRKRVRPKADIIHVCDSSPDGCGRIVSNGVDGPRRCLRENHVHDLKYRGKLEYAPMMRQV